MYRINNKKSITRSGGAFILQRGVILITIEKLSDGIKINGHAGYAPIGSDIVCAGVSALVQALIQSIEELTADEIEYDMQPGTAHIKHGNLSEQAQLLVDSFFVGVRLTADEYPENVAILKK